MNALSTVNASTFYFLNNIAVDISYGLTYYYTFDISTNNTNVNYLKNLATQVYDLSLVGTLVTSSPSPKYGLSSLYLTNSRVQPINSYNFVQTNGVTISFWTYFNITPSTTPILFFLGNSSTNLGIGINNSNNLYYYVNGSSYSTTNTVSITINTWTNITVSLDSNNKLKLYKAGALVDQRSSVSIASASYPMYLGGGAPGSSVSGNIYLGYMDDFRLYNNCLNGRQILNISKFAGISGYSVPVDPVGLMSYYRFEPTDVSGNTVSNFAGYLYNSTYNNLTNYTPIYDASFTNTAMVSYKKYNIGYGSFDISNSNYLQIPYMPPLANNGVSFSFWMRSNNNNDSGYYPLFNFGNGPMTDNIKFGLYNNKIVSSIQNGNTNALSFRLVTPPNDTVIVITNGGNNTILPISSPGYLIGPATDASMFYATSVMMTGYNILYGTSPANPLSGYIYPLTITSASAEWIATYSGNTYHQMVKATVTIVNGNAYVYSSEARYYTKSNYPSNYSTNVNSYASVIYAWNNSGVSALATTYNTPSGYAIYSINSIFFKNISNLLDSSTYTLSFTADTNTVYTGTYSRTNGDVITYSSLNNYWSNITLYNVAYINGIRISADGSKGAFITADTSLCYFFTKSGNTYSPAVGSNIASFTSTNIISTGYNLNLTGLDISLDGSRLVVSSQGTGGNIYYTNWDTTTSRYISPFTQITNISSGDYRGVAITPDKNIIVYGVNATNTVKYSLWNSSGNVYSTPYTISTTVGPPANFKFTIDGSILYYSLNGNTSGSNLYYSIWNGNAFNGFTSVGANIVPSGGYTTGLDVLSNNTVYVYKNNTGTSGPNVISYSITNNTTLTVGNLYTTPVNDNVWRHYAWTIDPSNQKYTYYVNGNVSSNVSGNSLTFPTSINNNSGLVLYYPLQNNGYNYASGCPVNDAVGKINPPSNGLVSHYTFDSADFSGVNIFNKATSSFDASLNTASILVDTTNVKIGTSSLYFNNPSANSQFVNLPRTYNISNGFSISFWARPVSVANSNIFVLGAVGGSNFFTMAINPTGLIYFGVGGGDYNTSVPITINQYDYWTVCISPPSATVITWRLYKNGVSVYNTTRTGSNVNPTLTYLMTLGRSSVFIGTSYSGNIDDLRMYNRTLTAQEVTDIYNPIQPIQSVPINNGLIGNSVANYPYLSLPIIPQNVKGYSFSFYFTPSSINQTGIIWSFNNATQGTIFNRIFMGLQNGNIQIGTGSTTFTSTIKPNANTSNLYVWTFTTSGTSNIYVNGNTSSVITTNTVPYYNSTNFNNNALFSDPLGGNVVAGTITEFRYYDRTLGSNDVTQLYGNSVSRRQNTIGASNSLASYFTGGIDEFQIYNRVLTSTEASQLSTMGPYYNLQGAAASPITGLVANNLAGSISISYNASQNYVKGYNISFSPSITGSPFTTNLLSTTYTGFVNETNYTANVYAVGVYGNSAVSQTSFVGIGVPTNLAVISATGNSITYGFTLSPGSGITYTASAIPTSGSTVTLTGITSSPVTISGLQSSMQYTINMIASNTYGSSGNSANIIYTTISSSPLTSISPSSVVATKYPLNGNISNNYIYYQFTSSGTTTTVYTATINNSSFDYLIVAGGGGGGKSMGSGGGAGGLLQGTKTGITSGSITITVGGGGVAMPSTTSTPVNGGNSGVSGSGISLTALGGGGGSGQSYSYNNSSASPPTGGSGGGATRYGNAGLGTSSQGNNGGTFYNADPYYYCGGGGGAGSAGGNATTNISGQGGNGISSNITGVSIYYAGGGGGSAELNNNNRNGQENALGGLGGGGNGSVYKAGTDLKTATNGTDGLGGGGGGGNNSVGTGGSGVVIIRFEAN